MQTKIKLVFNLYDFMHKEKLIIAISNCYYWVAGVLKELIK